MPNPTPEALVAKWRDEGIRLNGGADKPYTDDENSVRAMTLECCAIDLESALASREPAVQQQPAGEQGHAADCLYTSPLATGEGYWGCTCGHDAREFEDRPASMHGLVNAHPKAAPGAVDDLVAAADFASDVCAEVYAKYQLKIGPFASQAQTANVRLRSALRALASQPVAVDSSHCHYCDNNRAVLDPAKNYDAEMPCPRCRPTTIIIDSTGAEGNRASG